MSFFFMMAKVKAPVEEEVSVFCSLCGKETDSVYLCREKEMILCPKCQETYKMDRCPHKNGEHQHILVPGIKERNIEYTDLVLKISKKNKDGIRED